MGAAQAPGGAKPAASTAVTPTALRVAGDEATPLTLSAADLRALPRTTVTTTDEGRVVTTSI